MFKYERMRSPFVVNKFSMKQQKRSNQKNQLTYISYFN